MQNNITKKIFKNMWTSLLLGVIFWIIDFELMVFYLLVDIIWRLSHIQVIKNLNQIENELFFEQVKGKLSITRGDEEASMASYREKVLSNIGEKAVENFDKFLGLSSKKSETPKNS